METPAATEGLIKLHHAHLTRKAGRCRQRLSLLGFPKYLAKRPSCYASEKHLAGSPSCAARRTHDTSKTTSCTIQRLPTHSGSRTRLASTSLSAASRAAASPLRQGVASAIESS